MRVITVHRADLARIIRAAGLESEDARTGIYSPHGEPYAALVLTAAQDLHPFLAAAASVVGQDVALELARRVAIDTLGTGAVVYFQRVGALGPEDGNGSVRRRRHGGGFNAVTPEGREVFEWDEVAAWKYAGVKG